MPRRWKSGSILASHFCFFFVRQSLLNKELTQFHNSVL
ncbi:hypothetical Protein YC6258_01202 [Gynuella sunshinyii YC6258]|uniref:Uncharacterized protein n=1 Tax=Gynuella sunshinyii YC6258 TaxID=1445510 RepID=A0A0C5V189_9GAMM|nr:hypothetical Protein YC6258_01202 [Gynuella sunshinyii YC6258]